MAEPKLTKSTEPNDGGSLNDSTKLKKIVVNNSLEREEVPPLCGNQIDPQYAKQQFYLSTAINYTNGPLHIGHMYEAITSDVICRYHRAVGRDVFFLTGSDEHGQKVEQTAKSMGISPKSVADKYSKMFQDANMRLNISNDKYIRTTDPNHAETCHAIWNRVRDKGDIYLKDYVGWYNVHEECYVTDKDAEESNFMDEHGRPFEKKAEESYFFRLSKYQNALLDYITVENPLFIQPESRRNEMISFLSEPLHDLCISRTVCQWGVQCPENPSYEGDESHVMYVWFDALSNYLSGIRYFEECASTSRFWPANVHILGKDVVRFHTVIWPAMLLSAGLPLPETVFGHGHVVAADGIKMSKSLGNVPNPQELLELYPVDSFRFYLARSCRYGADLPFSEQSLCSLHNAILKDGLGNLLHRATSLCRQFSAGSIPEELPHRLENELPFDVRRLKVVFEVCFSTRPSSIDLRGCELDPFISHLTRKGSDGLQINFAGEAVADAIAALNRYLQTAQPWKLKGNSDLIMSTKQAMVRTVLEGVYIIAHFLEPFAPESMSKVYHKLGVKRTLIPALTEEFLNLPPKTMTYVGPILFSEIEPGVGTVVRVGGKPSGGKEAYEKAQASKKLAKEAAAANSQKKDHSIKSDQTSSAPEGSAFSKLDFRVGRIQRVWNHLSADRLFCEEIDIGEDKPRKIASGLREHYTLDELQGKLVVVLCNLKPRKLAGFESNGMVICATFEKKAELLEPPEGCKIGERIGLEGAYPNEFVAEEPNKVTRKKIFESVAPSLWTNDLREACCDGKRIMTSQGPPTTSTLKGAPLS